MEAQVTQEEVTREINRAVGRSSSRVASVPRSKRQRGR
jgi:hypothetical protein